MDSLCFCSFTAEEKWPIVQIFTPRLIKLFQCFCLIIKMCETWSIFQRSWRSCFDSLLSGQTITLSVKKAKSGCVFVSVCSLHCLTNRAVCGRACLSTAPLLHFLATLFTSALKLINNLRPSKEWHS